MSRSRGGIGFGVSGEAPSGAGVGSAERGPVIVLRVVAWVVVTIGLLSAGYILFALGFVRVPDGRGGAVTVANGVAIATAIGYAVFVLAGWALLMVVASVAGAVLDIRDRLYASPWRSLREDEEGDGAGEVLAPRRAGSRPGM